MKFQPTPLALALAAALGTAVVLPAQALQITTSATGFDNSASVTDAEGGSATTINNASLGSVSLDQFDSTVGVLMGTTLNLTSTRTQTITVTAVGSGKSSDNQTTTGTGSSDANISAAGVNSTFSTISANGSCTGTKAAGCTSTTSPAATTTNASLVAAGSLDSYVGGGTVLATLTAPTLTATQGVGAFPGAESTTYSVKWEGDVSATYDYLLHAKGSFDGTSQLTLDLDFGTFYLGDPATDLGFSIFNASGDRVGLDLDSILGSGDTTKLFTNLGLFAGLGAGSSKTFLASFDTSSLGLFSASYTLGLSDADVGASSSRFNNYSLTLNLKGEVRERQSNGIPEPGILGLLGIGLLGLAMGRRQRR